jgi:type IV pilus biogenesis protein CpaD/CtpE
MRTLNLLLLTLASAAGCANYPQQSPSLVDENFGQAVNRARARQVIDPNASLVQREPQGIDGQAAKSSIDRYQKSFDVPPPPVNVMNIGVGVGTGTRTQ